MPEFHAEPYIYLPTVTHESALVAWGAFYFRVTSSGKSKLVDDDDLKCVHPPRRDSIGACSAPYGPARVEVFDPGTGRRRLTPIRIRVRRRRRSPSLRSAISASV